MATVGSKKGNPKKSKRQTDIQNKVTLAREKYVHGFEGENGQLTYPTHQELAKEFGLVLQTVNNRSMKENWMDDRKAYEIEFKRKRDSGLMKERLKAAVDFDNSSFTAARVIQSEVMRFISDKRDEMTHVRGQSQIIPDNETEAQRKNRERDQFYNPFTGNVLSSLTTALHGAQVIGRLALGESTENLNVKHDATPLLDRAAKIIRGIEIERAS